MSYRQSYKDLMLRKPEIALDLTPREPVVCSRFGCGKHLTDREQLFGNKCSDCQQIKPININLLIKLP
jgi:hypothetical protein